RRAVQEPLHPKERLVADLHAAYPLAADCTSDRPPIPSPTVRGAPTPVERVLARPARLAAAVATIGLGIALVVAGAAMAGAGAGPVVAAGIVGLAILAGGLAWRPRGLEWLGFAIVAASVALGMAEGDDASRAPLVAAGLVLLGELTDMAAALRSPARME